MYDLNTNLFQYGEACSKSRLANIINNFPEHEVEIHIEKVHKEDVAELYYLMPHLKDLAIVRTTKKIDVIKSIANATEPVRQKNFTYLYLAIGVVLGSLLLLTTSLEYRNSVMVKAKNTVTMVEEFKENQPELESRNKLYTYVTSVTQVVNVESVVYADGKYNFIVSSTDPNLTQEDFKELPGVKVKKTSSLESKEGKQIHLYQMEGDL